MAKALDVKIEGEYLYQYCIDNNIKLSKEQEKLLKEASRTNSLNANSYKQLCDAIGIDPYIYIIRNSPTAKEIKKELKYISIPRSPMIYVDFKELIKFFKSYHIVVQDIADTCLMSYSSLSKYFAQKTTMPLFAYMFICDIYGFKYTDYSQDGIVLTLQKYLDNNQEGYIHINGSVLKNILLARNLSEEKLSMLYTDSSTYITDSIKNNIIDVHILDKICKTYNINVDLLINKNKWLDKYLIFRATYENIKPVNTISIKEENTNSTKSINNINIVDNSTLQKMTLNLDGISKEYVLIESNTYTNDQEIIKQLKDEITKLQNKLSKINTIIQGD